MEISPNSFSHISLQAASKLLKMIHAQANDYQNIDTFPAKDLATFELWYLLSEIYNVYIFQPFTLLLA